MKRLFVFIISVITIGTLSAQNLDEVIDKHLKAVNAEQLSKFKSLIVKGRISFQGMQLEMAMYEKAPGKIKAVSNISGMDIVQVINGDQGYMINPMMGINEPVHLTPEQIVATKNSSMLNSSLKDAYMKGNIEIEGEESVAGRPAFRIKVNAPEGTRYVFIDKYSYYITQVRMTVSQMGTETTIEMRMRDFVNTDGVIMARTIDTFMNGQPAGTAVYESIEFNREIDDSEFEIK